jgi:hypothetical protein
MLNMKISDSLNIFKHNFWYPNEKSKSITDYLPKKTEYQPVDRNVLIPKDYVKLYLEDLEFDQLYSDHGVTFTYMKIDNDYYVNSLHVLKSNVILDCYNDGHNDHLTLQKENTNKVNIIVKDINGKSSIKQIINKNLIS